MSQKICSLIVAGLAIIWVTGCGPAQQKTSPTSGSAFLYTSSSVEDLSVELADDFEAFYPEARIDIAELRTRTAVESLLFGTLQQVFLDRPLIKAESLAAQEHGIPIYSYAIAYVPLYFGVNEDNSLHAIDSVSLRNFLTGTWDNWKDAGGDDLSEPLA